MLGYRLLNDTVQSHPVRIAAVYSVSDCADESTLLLKTVCDHSTNPNTLECKLAVIWDTYAYVYIYKLIQSCQHWHQISVKLVHFSSSRDTATQVTASKLVISALNLMVVASPELYICHYTDLGSVNCFTPTVIIPWILLTLKSAHISLTKY